jgi:hypothetical protein
LDGESQDDSPNHTQSHFGVAINNFCQNIFLSLYQNDISFLPDTQKVLPDAWCNLQKSDPPSAPIDTKRTPLLAMKSRALLTLAIL